MFCSTCSGLGFVERGADRRPCVCTRRDDHAVGCCCWWCDVARGEDDGLEPFRAETADPTTCPHPDDDKGPVSGDGWLCGWCGADVEGPPGVTSLERILESLPHDDAEDANLF